MIHETKYTNRNKPTKEDLRSHKRYHEYETKNNFLERVYDKIKNENPMP